MCGRWTRQRSRPRSRGSDGYDALDRGDPRGACEIWLEVWRLLLDTLPDATSVEALDEAFVTGSNRTDIPRAIAVLEQALARPVKDPASWDLEPRLAGLRARRDVSRADPAPTGETRSSSANRRAEMHPPRFRSVVATNHPCTTIGCAV